VAAVAGAVGYDSEAAFSRAFKKLVGQTGDVAERCRRSPVRAWTSDDALDVL
jgi:AraC-like DNA-binding protein